MRRSIKSQHANVRSSTGSTPPLSGNRNRYSSRSSANNSPLATAKHEKPQRSSSQLSSNTHIGTSKVEQPQLQQSNLPSHNQKVVPQPVRPYAKYSLII